MLNIAWSWMGALSLILSGLFVSRYLIRHLGSDQYAIWALALSLVEYFWMIDLGVRTATVKLTAEFKALEKWDELNRLISTAGAYSLLAGCFIVLVFWTTRSWIAGYLKINHPAFPLLLQVVSLSWGFGLFFNIFSAGTEGFQRFDVTNRILVVFSITRSLTMIGLASAGYGLREMGWALLVLQFLMYAGFYFTFRAVHSGLRLSPQLVDKETALLLWKYGRQMISGLISGRLLQSAIPVVIARYLPIENVAYYSVTQRMLDYGAEGIGRVGLITAPRASDWMARGMVQSIIGMAEYANRYCLSLWLMICGYLAVYGQDLCRLWWGENFANHVGALLLAMLVGHAFWPGQFISGAILNGIGRFTAYSNSLLIEAVLTVIIFVMLIPVYGLVPAILGGSVLMILNRVLNLSWLFSREFRIGWIPYLWRIYRYPVLLAGTTTAMLWAFKLTRGTKPTLVELIAAGLVYVIACGVGVFAMVLDPHHRRMLLERVGL